MDSPWSPSSSESDRDATLDDDFEELRRACALSPTSGSLVAATNEKPDMGSDDDADEDANLFIQRIKAQIEGSPPGSPSSVPPLSTLPSSFQFLESVASVRGGAGGFDDDEDHYETLRNIERALARYEAEATSSSMDATQELTNVDNDETESCSNQTAVSHSNKFPKSAQMLFEALKKNRSCQKFVRRKLIETETKIEENKELRNRVKCLMDFQLACKKKAGHALAQKRDPRVRLISFERLKEPQQEESESKKKSALCFGPKENWWVLDYKNVQEQFPISLRKYPWSVSDKENLLKGIKQQCKEIFFLSSVNVQSNTEGARDMSLLPVFLNADFDITAEKMRHCMPIVKWDRVASMYLPGRSGPECQSRWLNCEDPLINHKRWTRQEEKRLLLILQNRGVYNWINISVELGTNRTPFQCLVRYQRSLNPLILNREWTKEEDLRLLEMVESYGDKNWQLVAAQLEGRAANQCATRWRQTLNPKRTIVGRWSLEEDKRLKAAVMIFGSKCWNKICQFVPGRTQPQCRERWVNCLDQALNHKPWSKEEDSMLLEAVNMHGHCWSKISNFIPSRTDNQCWRRWKFLCPQEYAQLKATRKIKQTMLISNFVNRQSERPEICPDDFAIVPEMINFEETNKSAVKMKPRKTRVKKRKDDNNAKKAVEQCPVENLQNSCLVEPCHDKIVDVENPILTTAPASDATVGTRKRRNSTRLENGNDRNGARKKRKTVEISKAERKKDPAWVHGERLESNRTHWKCKYCSNIFKGGGVFRLKMHIAGIAGDVVSCPSVPREIGESLKAELEKGGKRPEPRKRKQNGKRKEVAIKDSGPLQISLATGDVPAPVNDMMALVVKQRKKYTPKRKNQKETNNAEREGESMDRDAEKQGNELSLSKQKNMDKEKQREKVTMEQRN